MPQCEYLRVLRRRRPSEQGKPGQHLNKEPIDQTNRHDRRSSDVAIAQVKLDGRILDQFQNHAGFRGMCCSLEPEMEPETSAGLEELARRVIPLDVEMSTGHFPALLRLGERLPGLRTAAMARRRQWHIARRLIGASAAVCA